MPLPYAHSTQRASQPSSRWECIDVEILAQSLADKLNQMICRRRHSRLFMRCTTSNGHEVRRVFGAALHVGRDALNAGAARSNFYLESIDPRVQRHRESFQNDVGIGFAQL